MDRKTLAEQYAHEYAYNLHPNEPALAALFLKFANECTSRFTDESQLHNGNSKTIMGGIDREIRSIMAKTTVKAMTAKEFEAELWTNQDPQDRYTFAEAYAAHRVALTIERHMSAVVAKPPKSTIGERTPSLSINNESSEKQDRHRQD